MKKLLIKGALGLSTLLLSAAPAFSSTINLSFNFNSTLGTYSTNSSGYLTAASLQVTSVSVIGGGGTSLSGTGDAYTLYLASANGQSTDTETWDLYSGVGTGGSLLLAFTAQTTLGSGKENFSTTFGSVTSVSGTLATDGITVGENALAQSGNLITAAGGIANNASNAAVSSATLGLQITPTPEPATLAMLGSGLVGIALLRRRSKKTSL
jgi:hypothetical protein